jgi:ELWxxDGT repeat protein
MIMAARTVWWVAAVLILAAGAPLAGQGGPLGLLGDIAQPPTPVYPPFEEHSFRPFVAHGGALYFFSWDATRGQELWRSDGTAAGTSIVRDVCPGSCSGSFSAELVVSGGLLYFLGNDGAHGVELWRSDGTPTGTYLAADISPGYGAHAQPSHLTPASGGLYFTAGDGVHGRELWWSDGTPAGTYMVKDILPGNTSDNGPGGLIMLAGTLLFTANDGVHGRELWRSDGTAAGTLLVKDLRPGSPEGAMWTAAASAFAPAVAGGKMFFVGHLGVWVPWVTDGTEAGTMPLVTPAPGSNWAGPSYFFAFGDVMLFSGGPGDVGTLWRSDGSPAGTYALGTAANGGEQLGQMVFARLGDLVFFPGFQPSTGRELWVTDGTVAGTQLIDEIGAGGAGGLDLTGAAFVATADRLFFGADDGVHGFELWSTDGSPGGASMVADLNPGGDPSLPTGYIASTPAVLAEYLLFAAIEPRGLVLRSLDLQASTIATLEVPGEKPGAVPRCVYRSCPVIAATPAGVAFVAIDGPHGGEPWSSTGSPAGTELLADLWPGAGSSLFPTALDRFAALPDRLLLIGRASGFFDEVWALAEDSIAQLTEYPWGSAGLNDIEAWNGAGYFTTDFGLRRTDGTVAGTVPLVDGATRGQLTASAALLYFVRNDRLWMTDGSAVGTRRLAPAFDVWPGQMVVSAVGAGSERLYFAGFDAVNGGALWSTDGTDAGTRLVADVLPGPGNSLPRSTGLYSDPRLLAAVGNSVWFVADDGIHGEELWISDGTPGNATLLEIRPGAEGSHPRWLTAVAGEVYMVADDGIHGRELWVSNGKPAGTRLVHDLMNGAHVAGIEELTPWLDGVVFAADDGVHGMELWRAGTAGVELLVDLWPGADPSSPQGMTVSGERLFFFADDGIHGLEPWAWPAGSELFWDDFESGTTLRWTGGSAPE